MMQGEAMAQGGHMMGGMGPGMIVCAVLYAIVVVVFLWLMYRGVVALEAIAEDKKNN